MEAGSGKRGQVRPREQHVQRPWGVRAQDRLGGPFMRQFDWNKDCV